jgi:hypothetical protein
MADPNDLTLDENVIPQQGGNTLQTQLENTFDQVVTPEKPAEAAATPPAQESLPLETNDGRERDASGRFLPKKSSAPGTAAPAPAGTPTPQAGVPPAAPGAAAPQFNEAPQSWKAEMRPLYAKVPEEIRPYLHQREQELQHGFEAVARRGNVAEAVLNEFVPYAEQLQAEGATPITAMRTLLQTAHQLRTGGPEFKKALILSLAQQYGVDLSNPVNVELAKAEAQNANLLTEKMYGSAATQQQTVAQTQQEFSAFAADPQNEFFPQVRGIMALLIENNVARDLRSAYDMAIGMHAEVRKTLIDREYQSRVQAQKVQAAAGAAIRGAPHGAGVRQVPAGGESLRATIERNFGE